MNKVQREVADGVFLIRLPMPFRLTHVNVYLFLEEAGFTLIDTGPNLPGVLPALEEALVRLGRRLEDCRRVLVTHFHMDHCGLAGLIRERSGAAISLSAIEDRTIQTFSAKHGRAGHVELFSREHGLDDAAIEEVMATFTSFENATVPFAADSHLADGQRIEVGGRELEVLATPGHSRGHLSFYLPQEGVLVSGDHILPHITPNLSPDLTAPEFHPLESFLQSLTRIEALGVKKIWPAHGRPFADMQGRIDEMRKHHEERAKLALLALADGEKTANQVSLFIFGENLSVFDRFLALNESYVHLLALENRQLAGRRENEGGICLFGRLPE